MSNARLPDNVHRLKGTYQPSRHGDKAEKVTGLDDLSAEAPAWLPTEARREWRRVVKILSGKGVIADLDRPLLIQFCILYQKLYDERTEFKATDHAAMKSLAIELGMGAVSRSKIKVSQPPEKPKPEGWDGL